jgi:hypothetical protein
MDAAVGVDRPEGVYLFAGDVIATLLSWGYREAAASLANTAAKAREDGAQIVFAEAREP